MPLSPQAMNHFPRPRKVMEPFSITCHSCATRLKVANADLIEQTLACPKCGSMIHVQHPTGWKPPIPESKGSLSSIASGNDFDQIEDLLPKPGETARQAKSPTNPSGQQAQAKSKSEKARFQNPIPPTDAVMHPNGTLNPTGDPSLKDQPILPNQQWANPSAQKRKKLMLMIGSAIGTVLLVAITIAAIVSFGDDAPIENPNQVAFTDPEDNDDNQDLDNTEDNPTKSLPDDSSTKPSSPD